MSHFIDRKTEAFNHAKVTQLVSGKDRSGAQAVWLQSPHVEQTGTAEAVAMPQEGGCRGRSNSSPTALTNASDLPHVLARSCLKLDICYTKPHIVIIPI